MTLHPEVLWAQRSSKYQEEKNILYITINLPDILKDTLEYNLTPTSVSFKAKSQKDSESEQRDYAFNIDFYGEVVPEKSGQKLSDRALNLVIRKKDVQQEYWPRLTKEKVKTPYVKTDFSKWVDEDEQDGTREKDPNEDFDLGGMDGLGGGGFGGGMDFEKMMADMKNSEAGAPTEPDDSDDSDEGGPPPLEEADAEKTK